MRAMNRVSVLGAGSERMRKCPGTCVEACTLPFEEGLEGVISPPYLERSTVHRNKTKTNKSIRKK